VQQDDRENCEDKLVARAHASILWEASAAAKTARRVPRSLHAL